MRLPALRRLSLLIAVAGSPLTATPVSDAAPLRALPNPTSLAEGQAHPARAEGQARQQSYRPPSRRKCWWCPITAA